MATRRDGEWTDWQPLPKCALLQPAVLAEILNGGQAFRWNLQPDSHESWLGVFGRHAARIRLDETGALHWSGPAKLGTPLERTLIRYLNLGVELERSVDSLPWRSDVHLARCIDAFP